MCEPATAREVEALVLLERIRDDMYTDEFEYNDCGPDYVKCRACGGRGRIRYGNFLVDPAHRTTFEPIEHEKDCWLLELRAFLDKE